MVGGRGDIREGYFTREERALLERVLRDGKLVVPAAAEGPCDLDLHTLESLWQRGYLRRRPERGDVPVRECDIVFTPSGTAERALKRATS